MHDDRWPESVAGWELYREDRREHYRKRMSNGLTVFATWDGDRRGGTVEARVEPIGIGRTLTAGHRQFRGRNDLLAAARLVVDVAANLPSLRMGRETTADPVRAGEVAGNPEAVPGSGDVPEVELTFTLTDGRSITLVMTEEQTDAMSSAIHSVGRHVWSRYHDEEDLGDGGEPAEEAEVPGVSEVDAGPSTGHELMVVLEQRSGVTQDHLPACVDRSAVVVIGEPAVTTLLERSDELADAVAPGWFPGAVERPGEVWVVLHRAFAS
ncbi:hypothetical protein V1227_16025 [Lentzea sp. DG1S-22]|uniref:hypothetical protein n=1 Tax=Lentzea sp. DG1S-22 TaxID=3108822 RepID=UPI002E76E1E5|nr:hypothetical protein [Lentzea sp. DG1S-22]WVH84187.1 hypothetical protein V1227_16025 [Lentzea sp. DG1S-22]